ncbi:Protein ABC1-like protein [Colletotrichum orbiculare MAFF 240422]|uniref:Protein ABC1-like protein n=1 Tax=Colletotrichum orbiculare (strain 104-T / ATCC 96160 / CBS 514.97 / LARS 414 / MAFF 240422) TaxID=1213857 RepID=A0A484FVF8_COLOR|nr:Protein ABC1-like protein [Colletotrichum orbiculare MAFF 240422]
MSLASFQAAYTSEDNESFYKLIDKQNQKKADRYAWLWRGNKLPSKQMIKQAEVEERLSKTRSLIDDGFDRDRLAIKDVDPRPAMPDSWISKPKNNLMFGPEGVDDESEGPAQMAQAESRMAPKSINYQNTRVPQPVIASSFTRRSPTAPAYTQADPAQAETRKEPPASDSSETAEPTFKVTHVPHTAPSNFPSNVNRGSGVQPDDGPVLSQLRQSKPSSFPWSDASPLEATSSNDKTRTAPGSAPASHGAPVAEEADDVPHNVNVNIFHGSRAASLLGKSENSEIEKLYGARAKLKPVGLPDEDVVDESASLEMAPSSVGTEVSPDAPAGTKNEPAFEDVLGAAVDQSSTPAYSLRESSVPSTRLSRLWNYGGLAAGMMGGAITESIGRAFGSKGEGSVLLSAGNMERLVSKLSRMRGAALKMGQMMSFQDSKMLPAPIQEVLQRVQDRADYMPAWQRNKVLAANLGAEWRDLFEEFEEKPIAAASIGQVHRATLKDGRKVAVKIQFPGVADSINSDLDNLGILLNATKLLPKGLYLNKTIDNARLELGWECDYEREAQCLTKYKELLSGEEAVFLVPDVHLQASGKNVLTMDWMDGVGVTRVKSFTQDQRDWIGTQILRLCLREITEFKFMQTDPNWTNFLYNAETNKLELLDFGASREYPDEFVTQYVQLLAAASRSDRQRVKELSESLGYLTGHESKTMVDAHVKSVLTLAEPFLASAPEVYDFHDQTITERVKALIPVMLRERLAPPPEETYSLHRKLSGAFLLCAKLGSKVRCREMFEQSLRKNGYTA